MVERKLDSYSLGIFALPNDDGSVVDVARKSLRQQGELEQRYPIIDPLPPTPITLEAKYRLSSWGMTKEQIRGLQDVTSSLRYDLAPQKAARIAGKRGYISTNDDGTQTVVIPDTIDYAASLDGACIELSIQGLQLLHRSGILADINHADQKKAPIYPYMVQGRSRTHFNLPGDVHMWLGLLAEGEKEEKMITIDPAFQEISTTNTNGYKPVTVYKNVGEIVGLSTSTVVPVGQLHEDEMGGWETVVRRSIVLGLSADKKVIYNYSFVRNDATHEIRPVVTAQFSYDDPKPEGVPACVARRDGKISFGSDQQLNDKQRAEMKLLVETLGRMYLVADQVKAAEYMNQTTSVQINPDSQYL